MTQTSNPVATFARSYEISATKARVWEAFTDQNELTGWFAEHAEVSGEVGGPFRFWGRQTPTFGVLGTPEQVIEAFEPEQRLAFTWRLAGVVTLCEIRLDGNGETTTLSLRHNADATLPGFSDVQTAWIMRDFWQNATSNLERYLRRGAPALRVDHDVAAGGRVELSIELDRAPGEVWAALTEPSEIRRWLRDDVFDPDPNPAVDLRVGGVYSFGWATEDDTIGPKQILEIDEGKRLVYSWHNAGDATDRTEWTIEALGDNATRLTVRQLGATAPTEAAAYANGWGCYLTKFKDAVESPR